MPQSVTLQENLPNSEMCRVLAFLRTQYPRYFVHENASETSYLGGGVCADFAVYYNAQANALELRRNSFQKQEKTILLYTQTELEDAWTEWKQHWQQHFKEKAFFWGFQHILSTQNPPNNLNALWQDGQCLMHYILPLELWTFTANKTQPTRALFASDISAYQPTNAPNLPFRWTGAAQTQQTPEAWEKIIEQCIRLQSQRELWVLTLGQEYARNYSGDIFQGYKKAFFQKTSQGSFFWDTGNTQLFGTYTQPPLRIQPNQIHCSVQTAPQHKTNLPAHLELEKNQTLLQRKNIQAEHRTQIELVRNHLAQFCEQVKVTSLEQIHDRSTVQQLETHFDAQNLIAQELQIVNRLGQSLTGANMPQNVAQQVKKECLTKTSPFQQTQIGFFASPHSAHWPLSNPAWTKSKQLFWNINHKLSVFNKKITHKQHIQNETQHWQTRLQIMEV